MRRRVYLPLFVLSLLTGCFHLRPEQWAGRELKRVQHVILVQMDGLRPDLLEEYLTQTSSQSPDRALFRLTGAFLAGGKVHFGSAIQAGQAVTVLPSLPDPASATLVSGLPSATHGVRWQGQLLPDRIRTVHDLLRQRGLTTLSAGFPAAWGASRHAGGPLPDDEARVRRLMSWLSAERRPPALVTLRLDGLVKAIAEGGRLDGMNMLAKLDGLLAEMIYGAGVFPLDQTVVILTSGHGFDRIDAIDRDRLARYLAPVGVGPQSLHHAGGLIWVTPSEKQADSAVKIAARLAAVDSAFELVLARRADSVLAYDPELGLLRPLAQSEQRHPHLLRRVTEMTREHDVVALVRQRDDLDLDLSLGAPATGSGGATSAESVVPLVLSGPPMARISGAALTHADLKDVAPTVLALLGEDPAPLTRGGGRNLLPLLVPPAFGRRPASIDPVLAACRDAADNGLNVEATCGALLSQTRDPNVAAEALVALTVAGYAREAIPLRTARRALAVAAWLSPSPRWPAEDAHLRGEWPARPIHRRIRGGIAILRGDWDSALISELRDTLNLSVPSWTLAGEKALPISEVPLSIADGAGAGLGHSLAAVVARFLGADVVLWGDPGPRPAIRITAPMPIVAQWQGPAWLGTHVADDALPTRASMVDTGGAGSVSPCSMAPVTSGAGGEAGAPVPGQRTLQALCSYAHLTRGLSSLTAGLDHQATAHLGAATYLDPVAQPWRRLFSLWSGTRSHTGFSTQHDDWQLPAGAPKRPPTQDERWASELTGTLLLSPMDRWGFAEEYKRFDPLWVPDSTRWSGPRARLLDALRTLTRPAEETRLEFCQVPHPERHIQDLERAAASLTELGLPGLAALVHLRLIEARREAGADLRRTIGRILVLLRSPDAGWAQVEVSEALFAILERSGAGAEGGAERMEAERMYLLRLWEDMRSDRLEEHAERNQKRIGRIVEHFVGRDHHLAQSILVQALIEPGVDASLFGALFYGAKALANGSAEALAARLVWLRRIAEAALAAMPERKKPSAEQRAVRMMPHLLRAWGALLSNREEAAREAFRDASQIESSFKLFAELLVSEDLSSSVVAGSQTLATFMMGHLLIEREPAAQRRAMADAIYAFRDVFLKTGWRLGAGPHYKEHVEFTTELVQKLGEVAVAAMQEQREVEQEQERGRTEEEAKKIVAGRKISDKAWRKVIREVGRMKLVERADEEASALLGEARDERGRYFPRVVLLLEVLLLDALWIVDVADRGDGADERLVDGAMKRLGPLLRDWVGQSSIPIVRLLDRGARLAQGILRDAKRVQRVWRGLDGQGESATKNLLYLKRNLPGIWNSLASVLTELRGEIGRLSSDKDLTKALRDDNRDALILDHLLWAALETLPQVLRDPQRWADLEHYRPWLDGLYAHSKQLLTDPVDGLQHLEHSNLRVLLTLELGWLDIAAGRWDAAVRWFGQGLEWSPHTRFAGHEYIFHLSRFLGESSAGRMKEALAAIAASQAACPAQAWRLRIDLSNLIANRRAYDLLDEHLERIGGAPRGALVLWRKDDRESLTGPIRNVIPALLLFFLSESNILGEKLAPVVRSVFVPQEESPADAVMEALLLRLGVALARDDEAMIGRTLDELVGIARGLHPKWLTTRQAAAERDLPRRVGFDPEKLLEAFELAVLAEVHGHPLMAEEFLSAVAIKDQVLSYLKADAKLKSGLKAADKGPRGKRASSPPSDNPVAALARLRMRRFLGDPVSPAEWSAAVTSVQRLRQGRPLPLGEARLDEAPSEDLVRAAEIGYGCEAARLAWAQPDLSGEQAVALAERCGSRAAVTLVETWLHALRASPHAVSAQTWLRNALERIGRFGKPEIVRLMKAIEGVPEASLVRGGSDWRHLAPKRARDLAAMMQGLGFPERAVSLRALALAAEMTDGLTPVESASSVFDGVLRWPSQPPATTLFLKRLCFVPATNMQRIEWAESFLKSLSPPTGE